MPNPRSHSQLVHNSNSLNSSPHRWHVVEIVPWSILGWFYWMAFLVLLVWTVAQAHVASMLEQQPQIVERLYEYAAIGRNWRTLTTAADISKPLLETLQEQKSNWLMWGVRQVVEQLPLPSDVTLEVLESSLSAVVYVGDEMRSLNELERTAQDIDHFRASRSIADLRIARESLADGTKGLQQAQEDFDDIVDALAPFIEVTDSTFHTLADGFRSLDFLAAANLYEPSVQFADNLDRLPQPAVDLRDEALGYSKQTGDDVAWLNAVHHTVAVADFCETLVTYYIFRDFIQWFLTYVWWINGVVFVAIAIRLTFAYFPLFPPKTASSHLQPGHAAPPVI